VTGQDFSQAFLFQFDAWKYNFSKTWRPQRRRKIIFMFQSLLQAESAKVLNDKNIILTIGSIFKEITKTKMMNNEK